MLPVAVVFDLPEGLCQERNRTRPDRDFGPHVVRNQLRALHQSRRSLDKEGFRHIFTFESPEEIAAVTIERQPLWNNRKHDAGPLDIIGDIHGCFDELVALLEKLGYVIEKTIGEGNEPRFAVRPP
ncbi:MAG TPA: polynucleotide kinase-phosphatase, partial [Polyangia bacterium]